MIDRAILPSLWICGLLVIASLWMMRMHVGTWRAVDGDESREAHEVNYHRRQYRRRMQASGILGLLGIMILVGHFVRPPMAALVVALYWATALLTVAWLLVLACFDAISTRLYFGRMRRRAESQEALRKAKLRREKEGPAGGAAAEEESGDY